jgi:hypothetical protein
MEASRYMNHLLPGPLDSVERATVFCSALGWTPA